MLKQREAGVQLCLCSKNNIQDVLDVFKERTDMVLNYERDIAGSFIGWENKSVYVRRILNAFEFGEENTVFIDDRLDECTEVSHGFPHMLVIQLPSKNEIIRFFTHLWRFDYLTKPTEEDHKRIAFYQQRLKKYQFHM